MKKAISVFLCLALVFSTAAFGFAAYEPQEDYSQYPLILVPGYSSTRLVYDKNGENEEMVWDGLNANVLTTLLDDVVGLATGLGGFAAGNPKQLAKTVGTCVLEYYDKLLVDKNGNSIYPLERQYTTPEECMLSAENLPYESEIMQYLSGYLDEGADNAFCFNCDFRMGAIFCAGQLYDFVDDVLEYTNAEKVNIIAISHGGQVTGTYLSQYCVEGADHFGKVNNAVLIVPALGGAGFAYDALNAEVELDLDGIAQFVEFGEILEEDYHWLLQAQVFGFLDDFIKELLPYVHQLMGYWGSMWDFVPIEYYEDLKVKFFGDEAEQSAQLIANSDKMHYEIMPNYEENFASCKKGGANISIIAGTNNQIVTGLQDDSDAIITTAASTGATVAPLGKRFADGYTQLEDNGFYQVSPSMTIDASTGYLPYNTWYIEGLYHGMEYKDPYVRELFTKLLLTDSVKDVLSDPAFPQFHTATNSSLMVYAAFNNSADGFVSSKDTRLVLKNLSTKYDVKIAAVNVQGSDISFSALLSDTLAPGESLELPIQGTLESVSLKNMDILVEYVALKSATPIGERRFNFTVMNGEAVEFDKDNPLVDASASDAIDSVLGDKEEVNDILETVGVKPFIAIVFNIALPLIKAIYKLVTFFTGKK